MPTSVVAAPSSPQAEGKQAATETTPSRIPLGNLSSNTPLPRGTSKLAASSPSTDEEEIVHDSTSADPPTAVSVDDNDNIDIVPLSIPHTSASEFYHVLNNALAVASPSQGSSPSSQSSPTDQEQNKLAAKPPRVLTVFEGALALAKIIDDAVNKADESRGKKKGSKKRKAADALDKTPAIETAVDESAVDESKNNKPQKKKSWQQRAKDTDWTKNTSILANFPPPTRKKKYRKKKSGNLVPPPYMLGKYDCVYLKAHAVTTWNRLKKDDQCILKKQFVEMEEQEKYEEKERARNAKAQIRKNKTAANKRANADKRNMNKLAKRAQSKKKNEEVRIFSMS